MRFPWAKKENSQMKAPIKIFGAVIKIFDRGYAQPRGIEKYGKPNRNTSKTTSGFIIIGP